MNPKLIALILFTTLLHSLSEAQDIISERPSIRYGICGGLDLQTFRGKDYWGEKLEDKLNPGLHAGGNILFPVFNNFWVQPGLLFSVKGSKQIIVTEDITKTVFISYLELPVYLMYRPQAGNGYLLLGIGGYAGYGVSGRERSKTGTVTLEIPVRFLQDASEQPATYAYYKPFDAGGNILVGYEFFRGTFLHLNFQLGMADIMPDYGRPNDQSLKKHIGFGLTVGHRY